MFVGLLGFVGFKGFIEFVGLKGVWMHSHLAETSQTYFDRV